MNVSLKRVYEPPESTDGERVLVDRIWPRGITKEKAKIDLWLKDAAPSTELRRWFGHDPERWPEFQRKYRAELEGSPALAALKEVARKTKVTLVYAAKDENHNNAVVLRGLIDRDA
jgi:uncharacterized protein YeaO (DUF488 family)